MDRIVEGEVLVPRSCLGLGKARSDWLNPATRASEVQVDVPKSVAVPYGTSAVQLSNGKVLASGGNDETLSTIAEIVGTENLYATNEPICAYPVFACAGLHCLVTETPAPLVAPAGS